MTGTNLEKAKEFLEKGETVAIPTETVYGLAANALDQNAVLKIFKIKKRPSFDPLIVHIHSLDTLSDFVQQVPEKAKQLAASFWPGPLTLVLPKSEAIPDIVTSGLNTVALRIPSHPLTQKLLKSLSFPLAAPSANPFGYISPTTAEHVFKQLGEDVPYILDGGSSQVGLESSIIGFEGDQVVIYRLGGISLEAIEKVVGRVEKIIHSTSNPKAPGMLSSHYAPKKEIKLLEKGVKSFELSQQSNFHKIGILAFQYQHPEISEKDQYILSKKGSLEEAAKNLFAGLRYLDELNIDIIYTELVPDEGLGRAINDRIRRATV